MARQDENELYAQWQQADPANRPEIETKLYAAVRSHVQAVLWKRLEERAPDLVDEAVNAVMVQLGGFRQESKFSTWVEAIARKQAAEYIRSKVSKREVFDEYGVIREDYDDEEDSGPRVADGIPSVLPQMEGEIAVQEFRKGLSDKDAILLRYKEQKLTSKQIARKLDSTVEAIDSQWARLKRRSKKFWALRRK